MSKGALNDSTLVPRYGRTKLMTFCHLPCTPRLPAGICYSLLGPRGVFCIFGICHSLCTPVPAFECAVIWATGRIFVFSRGVFLIFYDHGAYFEFVAPAPAFGTGRIFVFHDHGAYFSFVITFARPYLRSSVLSYGPRGVFSYFHGAYFRIFGPRGVF